MSATLARVVAWCRGAITVGVNFARENAPESSTRLCMIMFGITGCLAVLGTVRFAFVNPHETGMVLALAGIDTLPIGGGAVAIALRMRKNAEPGDDARTGGAPSNGGAA